MLRRPKHENPERHQANGTRQIRRDRPTGPRRQRRLLLRQRRGKRWNGEGAHFASLRPGHPVYDRLKAEWQEEERKRREAEAPMIVESINRKLELMRRRLMAPDVTEDEEAEGEESQAD